MTASTRGEREARDERDRGHRCGVRRAHHRRVPRAPRPRRRRAPTSTRSACAALSKGEVPILEEGLPALVAEGLRLGAAPLRRRRAGRRRATPSSCSSACRRRSRTTGAADLSAVEAVAREIAPVLRPGTVVVNKSTMPVGSTDAVARALQPAGAVTDVGRGVEPRVPARGQRGARLPRTAPGRDRLRRHRGRGPRVRALPRRPGADPRHRPGVGRDDQVRVERVPRHQDLVRQRDRQPVRGGQRRRARGRARHGLRPADRVRVPAPGSRVTAGRASRRTPPRSCTPPTSAGYDFSLLRGVVDVNRRAARAHRREAARRRRRRSARARPSASGASRSRPTPTTSATRRRWCSSPSGCSTRVPRVRAYDPAAGEAAAARLPGARRRRPTRTTRPRARRCSRCSPSGTSSAGSTSTGCTTSMQPPLRRRRRPQPARSGGDAPARLRLPGRRPLMPRAVVTGGAGFLGSHLCRALHARGWEVVAVDNLSTGFVANVADLLERPRLRARRARRHRRASRSTARSTRCCTSRAPRARRRTSRTRSRRSRSARSAPSTRSSSRASTTALASCSASTSEIYGDPLVQPAARELLGQRQPGRARGRCTTRRSASPRRSRWRTTACTASTPRSCASSTPTARSCGPTMAGWCRTSSPRRCGATAHRLRRRQADAVVLLRDDEVAGLLALLDSDHVGPMNIGNPDEFTMLELAGRVLEVTGSTRSSCSSRCPTTTPGSGVPTSRSPSEVLGWHPTVDLREGLARTYDWYRRSGGTSLTTRCSTASCR